MKPNKKDTGDELTRTLTLIKEQNMHNFFPAQNNSNIPPSAGAPLKVTTANFVPPPAVPWLVVEAIRPLI